MKHILFNLAFGLFILTQIHAQTSSNTAGKTLGSDLGIQPNGQQNIIFDAIQLEKDYNYIITITGIMKPDYSSHVWGCNENAVERHFNCDVGLVNPFAPNEIIKSTHLASYTCGPIGQHPAFRSSCSGDISFSVSFAVDSVTKDKIYQVYFINIHSNVEYNHTCGPNNPKGGFEFPILLLKETKINIVKVKA
jgi:hypothetical protein